MELTGLKRGSRAGLGDIVIIDWIDQKHFTYVKDEKHNSMEQQGR